MDFQLTEEQKFIKDTIRKFISRECPREVVRELDAKGEFPEKLFKFISGMEFCGLAVPEEFGGGGRNVLGAVIVAEELSSIYPALAGAFIGFAFCGGKNISELGSSKQKEKYLPGIAQGSILFTYGVTEPGSGYGATAIDTSASKDGDRFILNGTKLFVRLANHADYIITLACTEKNAGNGKGLSFFIVDRKSSGITVKETEKVGYKSLSLCEVVFNNVSVPSENLLGGLANLNKGQEQLSKILESEHLEIAASSLGIAQGAYDYAANYARERVQFGRPIAEFEAVRHMLVDMATAIQSSRLLTYRAGWLADKGENCLLEAAMARTCAVEAARKVCLQCLQILGGYGYTIEYDAQRYVRDSLVLLSGGGTIEVLKNSMGDLLDLS